MYFNQEELNLGSNGQTLAAMRLGMIISTRAGEERRIFKLDGLGQTAGAQAVQTVPENGTVVASVSENGQASYTAIRQWKFRIFLQEAVHPKARLQQEKKSCVRWKKMKLPRCGSGCIWKAVMNIVPMRFKIWTEPCSLGSQAWMQMEKGAVHSETTLSNMVPGGDSHCGPAGPDSGYLRLVYFQ